MKLKGENHENDCRVVHGNGVVVSYSLRRHTQAGQVLDGETFICEREMIMDDYIECLECGKSIPAELNGYAVSYCPFCGADISAELIEGYGLEQNQDDE